MRSSTNRILAASVLVSLAVAPAWAQKTVGYLKIEKSLAERQMVAPFLFAAETDEPTLRSVIDTVNSVASPEGPDALVIRLSEPQLTNAQVEELGAAIQNVRKAGKKVHVFTESYEPTSLILGSYADEVMIQSGGAVMFPGLYAEEMFLADGLRWIGIEPDFVQIGDYKGAMEMMANSAPSPQWEQNINQLLDSVFANMTAQLREGRGISQAQLEQAMGSGLFIESEDAVTLKLLDRVTDRAELDSALAQTHGDDFEWDTSLGSEIDEADLATMNPFQAFGEIMKALQGGPRGTARDTIAVLHIDGPIVDGKSSGGGFMSGPAVGSLTIREAIRELENDPNIRGVIVRVNSPGGSAIASEIMLQGIRRLAVKMPVWTSVGSMAASGGYYVSVATDRIYVNRSSIVGSIGVVGGKLAMKGLWDKLRVNVVPRARGPLAGMMGGLTKWNDAERAAITRDMQRTYDRFVGHVKKARPGIDIAKTAEGRLFTGDKAVELKMADAIGGLDIAVADMAAKVGLTDGDFDVLDYPAPMTLQELLEDSLPFAGAASADQSAFVMLREAIGERAWEAVRDGLTALMQMRREPVLLVSPRVVIFK